MNIEQLTGRYSVKKFDPHQKIAEEKIGLIKKAFHLCPSSVNIQCWKLIVVESDEIKSKLASAGLDSNGQRIREASHILVLCRRHVGLFWIKRIINNTTMLKPFRNFKGIMRTFIYRQLAGGKRWEQSQVYLALGFVLSTCASLGVGALPMEGILKFRVNSILGIKQPYRTVCLVALGEPHQDDATNPSRLNKDRLPFEEVVETR